MSIYLSKRNKCKLYPSDSHLGAILPSQQSGQFLETVLIVMTKGQGATSRVHLVEMTYSRMLLHVLRCTRKLSDPTCQQVPTHNQETRSQQAHFYYSDFHGQRAGGGIALQNGFCAGLRTGNKF